MNEFENCISKKESDCKKSFESILLKSKSFGDSTFLEFLCEYSNIIYQVQGLDSSLPLYIRYRNEAKSVKNVEHQLLSYDKIGKVYLRLSNYNAAKENYEKGIQFADNENKMEDKVKLQVNLASAYRSEGDLQRAEEIAFEALEAAKINSDYKGEGSVYRTLGSVFGMNRQFEKSMKYSLKAATVLFDNADSMGYCICNINAANAAMSASKFDTAQVLLSNTISILRKNYDPYIMAGALVQQGRSRYFSQDYVRALESFDEAKGIAISNGNKKQVAFIESMLAETYLEVNRVSEGMRHAQSAYSFHKENGVSDETASILNTLAKAYELQGNDKLAFRYYKTFVKLRDSLSGAKRVQQLLDLEMKYETKIKQEKIISLENHAKYKDLRSASIIMLISLLALYSFLLVNKQRNKIKANRIILQQKEELHKEQVENESMKREKLQLELAQSKREITSSALKIAEGNELINRLEAQLKAEPKSNALTTKLLRTLNSSRSHEKDWNKFLEAFESIHPNYIQTLKSINPKLTASDIRLCSLERMNFDRNQIAAILHISVEGVKKARYRLKKKLNLDPEVTVVSFLHSI